MASKLTITFNGVPQTGGFIRLFNPFFQNLDGLETFVDNRSKPKEVSVSNNRFLDENSNPTPITVEQVAFYYKEALRLDINASNSFNITVSGAVVIIDSNADNIFDGLTFSTGLPVSFEVEGIEQETLLEITNIDYSQSDTDPCNKIKVTVTGSKLFDSISQPIQDNGINADTYQFEINRGITYNLVINEGQDTARVNNNSSINKIVTGNIVPSVSRNPNGVILTVNYDNPQSLLFTYSINDIDYQESKVFPGLMSGDYIIYVRDQYGCTKSIDYTIEDIEIGESTADPYIFIPRGNPVYFVKDRDLPEGDNYGVEDLISRNGFSHKFLSTDSPTIQIQSSYPQIKVSLLDCDQNFIQEYPVDRKIININIYDARDANVYLDEDGFLRVYFTSGNTYGENMEINGSHNLNGAILEFYAIGSFIKIGETFEQITAIEYNAVSDRIDLITSGSPESLNDLNAIVSMYYNELEYDVYESAVNFAYDGYYQLLIEYGFVDADPKGYYLSEPIDVGEIDPHHHIKAWSNLVSNINHSQGFYVSIRVPYDITPTLSITSDLEQYEADNRLVSIDDNLRDNWVFKFERLPENAVLWLREILSNTVVFIDGKQFKKVGEFEIERIGTTNQYSFDATMRRQYNAIYRIGEYNPYLRFDVNFPNVTYATSNGDFIDSNGLVIG